MELPELGEHRLFVLTPTGTRLELVFRQAQAARSDVRQIIAPGITAALAFALADPALAAEVQIDDLVATTPIPPSQRDATVKAARAFDEFWNTGDEAVL